MSLYTFLLIVLTFYAFHAYLMIFLYKRRKKQPLAAIIPSEWPKVTVQLPIFNEQYVVERLIHSVCRLDYPLDKLEIQILDDSTDETRTIVSNVAADYLKKGYDIQYLHRTDRNGFKAGALKKGLESAKGEFVAIFDADFLPQPDFLKKMIPYFSSKNVGVVQARWGHLNGNMSLLTKSQTIGLDAHFVIEHSARNANNIFINFNGTAGIWRKETILDAGNWQDDTLTEDIDISYRAQLAGWKFVYVNDVVCPAEVPAEVNGLKTQQYRWAKGAIQTAIKLLPKVWKNRNLSTLMKFEATIHLTNHLVFPVLLLLAFLIFPILVVRMNCPDTNTFFMIISLFTINAFSYPLFYVYAQKEIYPDWKRRVLFMPILMAGAIGLAVINSRAVVSAVLGRKSKFTRTPKYNLADNNLKSWRGKDYRIKFGATALIELLLFLYISASLFYAFQNIQYLAIPFILFYWFGFAFISSLSLLHSLKN